MRIAIILLVAMSAFGASFRLYLKDGEYHTVSEYSVEGDRVRYYSTERSDWELIPLDLVDIKKTESIRNEAERKRTADAAAQDAEDEAERAIAREISRIPQDIGVYLSENNSIRTIPQAEVTVVTDKKRALLKIITPVPLVPGKSTVEVDGERSKNVIKDRRPEFYLRMNAEQRMTIVRMGAKKGARIVEKAQVMPVTDEVIEEQDQVETFRRQFAEDLFKLWPTKDLEPGEYAVVWYTDGKLEPRAWDFRIE